MSEKLFFSQNLIDSWCEGGKAQFDANTLVIEGAKGKKEFDLTPAFRVLRVAGGAADPHALIGLVKTEEECKQIGAEPYLDSMILGETAYDVEPGYVAVRAEDEKTLDEMLTEYLLKTLI